MVREGPNPTPAPPAVPTLAEVDPPAGGIGLVAIDIDGR